MKVLELFCGTKSFTKVAEVRGHECRTLDNDPRFEPTYCMDMTEFDEGVLDHWHPDIIWASPPCECFSVNTIGMNWNKDYSPKSAKAEKALREVEITMDWIDLLNPQFYIVENPRAMLRKMWPMEDWPRKTVTYCQYGEPRMKPTDLWTNVPFEARSCNYGDPCHPRTPRGCYSGKSYQELSKVPVKLCKEILIACENANGKEGNTVGLK